MIYFYHFKTLSEEENRILAHGILVVTHTNYFCLPGGVLTSTDIRTYQPLRFVPEYVDVIMVLEVKQFTNT